jgi:tRNA threonylcarbamoyl adenosine modification protein YeaZ
MQKQKIDPLYLTLHSDYHSVFCGLFKGAACLAVIQEHKLSASKNLMLRLTTLLKEQEVSWADLDFIGVNQGPSPFTTLRVVITTVNGLLFAKKIPLVGVDGLRAFLSDYTPSKSGLVVTLLNAFNNDIYFGIKYPDGTTETGWGFYATFLNELQAKHPTASMTFTGNGVTLHREAIRNFFPDAYIPNPLPESVGLLTVAACALKQWQTGETTSQPLLPLYLKTMNYKPST